MAEPNYFEIYMSLLDTINGVWEIWLAITFAVIVAFHFSYRSISTPLLVIGVSLYISASLGLMLRYVNYAFAAQDMLNRIDGAGYETPQFAFSPGFIGVLSILTIALGTLATVGYAVYKRVYTE